jgi:peptidyl-prolyl cis-trans isomerase B (cyclophilin B)
MKGKTLLMAAILVTTLSSTDCTKAHRDTLVIETNFGTIQAELYNDIAPKTVAHMEQLAKEGFFDSLLFHRVIPGFVIQGGDPNTRHGNPDTWGIGQQGQPTVQAEFSKESHKRGILSMARKGNDVNSGTSQFFVCVADVPSLDNQYTVWGKVTKGMEVVDKIVALPRDGRDRPEQKVMMTKVTVIEAEQPQTK